MKIYDFFNMTEQEFNRNEKFTHEDEEVIIYTDNNEIHQGRFEKDKIFIQDSRAGYSGAIIKFIILSELKDFFYSA